VSAERNAVRIRIARPYDAAALLDLKRQLDEETAFMMYEPGERDSSVQDLARELAGVARSPNSVILLAELADQLAGYLELTGGSFRRSRATAYLVIGVRADAAGRGIGTGLLQNAHRRPVHRRAHHGHHPPHPLLTPAFPHPASPDRAASIQAQGAAHLRRSF
jgi:GNAT superfamily N-acetyltransferase